MTITGDKKVIDGLSKMGKSLYLWNREMRLIGTEVTHYFANDVMNSQGGAIGERWPKLSEARRNVKATGHASLDRSKWRKQVTKAKAYPGAGPLIATGAMKKSFTSDADETSVTITNSAEYFAYHQSSQARKSALPRRVMMKSSQSVRDIVGNILEEGVKKKIKEAGLA